MGMPLYIVLAAVLCAAAGYVYLRGVRGRAGGYRIADREAARALFTRAVELRSLMTVSFTGAGPDRPCCSGPCLRLEPQAMSIDVGSTEFPAEMKNEDVLVRFTLPDKENLSYHQFMSRVRGIRHSGGGGELLLDIPDEIGCGQRRNFFRVSPSRESVQALRIWMIKDEEFPPAGPAGSGVELSAPDLDMPHCSLANISTGGLCIQPHGQESGQFFDALAGERLICFLSLRPVKTATPPALWLDCTVRNRGKKEGTSFAWLGVSFRAWAEAGAGGEAKNWTKVRGGGYVVPLADWVWQYQLAQRSMLRSVGKP